MQQHKANMQTEYLAYVDQEHILEGFVAYPSSERKYPTVILCHAWSGRDAYICEKAQLMAQWGYVGFALDMYGKGILGTTREQNKALKQPFLEDRQLLQKRLLKALEIVCALPYVDTSRIAVVGFGFGGLCALDFARSGANLKGAVCVYGHFEPLPFPVKQPIKARILVLHGYEDHFVPPQELLTFGQEMQKLGVDWQAHLYGNSQHAFTNPAANDVAFGTVYNAMTAQRAWNAIHDFLKEVFEK